MAPASNPVMPPSSQSSEAATLVEESEQIPQPDLAFPSLTTDVERAGYTNEYRQETKAGLVPFRSETQQPHPLPAAPKKEEETLPDGLKKATTKYETLKATDPERAKDLENLLLVTWKINDPENPANWSTAYKWFLTAIVSGAVVQVAFASAVLAGCFAELQELFQVSEVVAALSVSLMVCGFGIGPCLWSPSSELFGRKICWIAPFSIYVIMNIPCALAPNIGALLSCRFICGLFGSGPLALAGGTIADIWRPDERGLAIAIFAAAPYGGPVLGPIVGGFVGETVGFRWVLWVNMMFAGVILFLLTFVLPETYAPLLLKRRAAKLRAEHNTENIRTEQEVFKRSVSELLKESLVRPFILIVTEPILVLFAFYAALIYGLLYSFFFAFPVIYEPYGYSEGIESLMFIPVLIGVAIALFVLPPIERRYVAKYHNNGGHLPPEERLTGMMIGAPMIPISLFILGWTAPPYVSPGPGTWVGPCSAGIPFGCGMTLCYFSVNAYLIDTYPSIVASSLATKTVIRSGLGAAFPLFITAQLHNLTNGWGESLLAFIALAMCFVPFLFKAYGGRIRKMSKLTVQ